MINPLYVFLCVVLFIWQLTHIQRPSIPAPETISSNGDYKIDVVGVEYDTVEAAFAPDDWEGEPKEEMNGIRPKVIFTITNTTDEEKLMMVPAGFYISSDYYDEERPQGVWHMKHCDCYASNNVGKATLVNEQNEYTSPGDRIRAEGDKTALLMDPGEVRRFKVFFFSPPFHQNEGSFNFRGYTYTNKATQQLVEVVFNIDIATRKVKSTRHLTVPSI